MKIQTINQLVSVWKDIATRHYQINGFGIGDEWEIGADKAYMHPVLWINPVSASMPSTDYGYKTFEIDFEIRIFDLVNKDESNENDVLSDTIDILKDIITEFKGHPYYVNSQLNIIGDIDFEAFTESFDEEVSGWSCEISLMTPVLTTFCGIPATDITGFVFPGIDCPDVNVLCPVFVENVTGVYPIVVTTTGTTKEVSLAGGVGSDTFVISGTYNTLTDNLELLRNDSVTVLVDLSNINTVNTFVTSATFNNSNNNNLVLTLNDGSTVTTSIDNFNGLDVTGTVNATAFVGDGSGLTGLPSGGEVNTSSNSGTGEGLALTKVGSDLPFKSITAGTGITLTSSANELQINSASSGGDNISNADLTFNATYNADLNGNDWSIKDGSDTLLSIDNDGSFTIGKDAENNSTNVVSKHLNTVVGSQSTIASANIQQATAVGYNNTVNTTNGLAVGQNNTVNLGTSIGHNNTNTSYEGISVGAYNTISNTGVISVGVYNETNKFFTQMLGWSLKPLHDHVTMLGRGDVNKLQSTASKQFIVGWNSPTPTILIGATSDSYIKSTGNLSLETNTTVKGSDNSASTTGFKVTDVNDLSLLDIKNDGSFIIGKGATNNNVLSKNQNVLIGQNATIGAGNSEKAISIGYNASATLTNSIAIGGTATTGGVSIGVGSVAGGVAVALLGSATSDFSIGIGSGASSSNTGAISIGKSAVSSAQYTTSLGYEAESTSNFAIALGWNTESNAYMGLSLGSATEVNHAGSIVLGTGFSAGASALKSTSTNQLTVGFNSVTPTMVIGATTDSYIKSTGNLSLETDTTVKGSDTLVGTTGFKVTDSTNASLLEVKNNGIINASNLPTSSTGLSSGDIWNNGGVLNIV